MEDGKWITLKDGRKILLKPKSVDIKNTNEYMNSKLRKEYTKKDIKTLKDENGVRGYELNGMYLLKKYYGLTGNRYEWIINKKENDTYWFYNDFQKQLDEGNIEIKIYNSKQGKERLIELANKKGGK